ncbi:protein Smaug homolog 2-like [Metopolophium dirhodum]|uniref:protein Smaug homolog 2-like n=1 Tax=Metopolophium dirhodum TaxID=44670 RepID=UPI0029905A03|nr:protein Smaug homolog 2-like [Metopolophium dirhodum]
MDEMKQLAETLMQCKSFKERQERLSESLDHLSFNYPDLYTVLYREMKKRELDSNDPSKITKWLNNQPSKSFVKLHEALMLVKNNNIMAKEEYMYTLRRMLNQTIENGTNIEIAVKICNLIEKSPNLTIIHENLKHLIRQVNQLNNSEHHYMPTETLTGNLWPNYFRPPHIDPFQPFNIRPAQQPNTSVWPNILQPTNLNSAPGLPHFRMECFGYNHLEMIAKTNRATTLGDPQSLIDLTILNQDMDGAVAKWLHYLKLHKYQWFFNSLSYLEIEFIDEDNIEDFIAKVNKNSITKGAQKKICLSTKALRDRSQKLNNLLLVLDLEVTPNELCEFMSYMRDILHYPIPNKNCVVGDQLQQDIVLVMEKLLNQLLEKLGKIRSLVAQSLLGMSINKYLECTLLIFGNQTFMKHQIDKTLMFAETLKCRVHRIPRNFN